MTPHIRPCKFCNCAPRISYHVWKAAPPVVELQCPECTVSTHSYSESTTIATWNAMNLPEEKS